MGIGIKTGIFLIIYFTLFGGIFFGIFKGLNIRFKTLLNIKSFFFLILYYFVCGLLLKPIYEMENSLIPILFEEISKFLGFFIVLKLIFRKNSNTNLFQASIISGFTFATFETILKFTLLPTLTSVELFYFIYVRTFFTSILHISTVLLITYPEKLKFQFMNLSIATIIHFTFNLLNSQNFQFNILLYLFFISLLLIWRRKIYSSSINNDLTGK